jgi:hypothetical protein
MAFLRLSRLRREEGLVLPIALGILAVLSIAVIVVVDSSTSSARSSTRSGGDKVAFALAEAGINNSMAVLNLPSNNALKQQTLVTCAGDAETTWNRSNYEGGYVLWCGTFNAAGAYWDVTAIGKVRNASGSKVIERKIGARVVVTPTTTQPLNNPAWNYLFNKGTDLTCDMTLSNNVGGSSRLYVAGDLCISNNAGVTSSELIVHGNLSLGNNAYVGASTSLDTRVPTHVGGNCQYAGGAWTSPNCGGNQDSRMIFSKIVPGNTLEVSTTPPVIGVPVSDFALWYTNAIPGPTSQTCTTLSGTVPVFDNDTTRNNSVSSVFELTPATSYTCLVGPAETPSGELSWNASTKVLTVSGTIFIDGSLKMTNGFLNQYNGQATIYLSGTFYAGNNTKLCGGTSGSECDFPSWNPNTEMLTITTEGSGGLAGTGNGIKMDNNSQFQGALYAVANIEYTNNSRSDGPMVAEHLIFANNVQNDSFPTITVVPVGQPGNPAIYAQPNPPQMFSG